MSKLLAPHQLPSWLPYKGGQNTGNHGIRGVSMKRAVPLDNARASVFAFGVVTFALSFAATHISFILFKKYLRKLAENWANRPIIIQKGALS